MKGINAVGPLAIAISASAVSASAVPNSLIPSYFKRASSLPEVTVKGNGMNALLLPSARNANARCQPSLRETRDSIYAVSTTSQEALQMLWTQLLMRLPAHVTLKSKDKRNTQISWPHRLMILGQISKTKD